MIDEKDQEWIYDPTPAFSYGLNIYLEYKNFDLTMFWQGVQGVDIISDVKKKSDFWSASNVGFLNKGTRLLNAWSPTNPNLQEVENGTFTFLLQRTKSADDQE